MISAEEIRRHAGFVGVPKAQIVRDHLISHVIDALSREAPAALTFFTWWVYVGGPTAPVCALRRVWARLAVTAWRSAGSTFDRAAVIGHDMTSSSFMVPSASL